MDIVEFAEKITGMELSYFQKKLLTELFVKNHTIWYLPKRPRKFFEHVIKAEREEVKK